MTRLYSQINQGNGVWWDQAAQWVSPTSAALRVNNTYSVAENLNGAVNYTVRVQSDLEPSFSGASPTGFFTFAGFIIDGTALPATPQPRKLEIVGDSISAGYGSRCDAFPYNIPGGDVMDFSSGNTATYNHHICEHFGALCSVVAWSGKGMYENCCDQGERMPSYYLQTRGGTPYSADWDFSSFVPDAILINLGTNDFGHDSGPAWEANFTSTYVAFVLNATRRYGRPTMPVFVAQGPMNNGVPLYTCLHNAIDAINAAGGNAIYLDMRGPPNDGCGGHPGVQGHLQMYQMAVPTIANATNWLWSSAAGFISDGGDVLPAANSTIADAQALCLATAGCRGITFPGAVDQPGEVLVYFKNHTDTSGSAGWSSFILAGRV
jgi:hypothetical protein